MMHPRFMAVAAMVVMGASHAARAAPSAEGGDAAQSVDASGTSAARVGEQLPRARRDAAQQDKGSSAQEAAGTSSPRPKTEPPSGTRPGQEQPNGERRARSASNLEPVNVHGPRAGALPEPKAGTRAAVQIAALHFDRALRAYRQGDYQSALVELHRAAALDPASKDLEYNLALVHERAGQTQDAVQHWKRFRALEPDARERHRAELAIRRLEGAHARQLHMQHHYARRGRGWQGSRTDAQVFARVPERRFDDWAVGTSIASVAFLCVGVALGLKALQTDPDRGANVADTTQENLEARADSAHSYALGADLAFAVSVGMGTAAAVFWFADERGTATSSSADLAIGAPGLRLGGTF